MKVLQVVNWYIPEYGYQEYFLADAWQRAGHEVLTIAGTKIYPHEAYSEIEQLDRPRVVEPGEYVENGTVVRRLPSREVRNRVFLSRQLEVLVREFAPDTVVAHGVTSPNAVRLTRLKNKTDKPFRFVCDEHMLRTNSQNGLVGKAFYGTFRGALAPRLAKAVDAFVAISEETAELLATWCGIPSEKTSVVPLGVDTQRFNPDAQRRAEVRERLGIASDDVLIVFAGKLVARKRLDLLVDAARQIMGANANVKLLVIGSGKPSYVEPQQTRLADQGLDLRTMWLPLQPNDELSGYFRAADIGVWPAGPSIVILEAAATGLAVVCEAGPYHRERFPDGSAMLFDGYEQMVEMLSGLVDDAETRKSVGLRGKAAVDEYSWDRVAERFLEV